MSGLLVSVTGMKSNHNATRYHNQRCQQTHLSRLEHFDSDISNNALCLAQGTAINKRLQFLWDFYSVKPNIVIVAVEKNEPE